MEYGKRQFQERYPDHEPLGRNVEATATMAAPHPYLTRAEVEEHLSILGVEVGTEERVTMKLNALRRLIAGAIAEWADVGADDDPWEALDAELIDFAIGYTDER